MHTRCAGGAHAVRVRACSHRSSASTPNCAARLGQIAPRSLRFTQPSSASLSATTTSQVGYLSWCPASFHPPAAAAACFSASATTHAHSSALATPRWGTRQWETRQVWPASQNISADWPRREAALSLVWRWRGVSELEGTGRSLQGGWSRQGAARVTCTAESDARHSAGTLSASCGICSAVRHEGGGAPGTASPVA
eukprot:scaffold44508_cov69-Phaeocystis_antarctica.AAC.1